MFFRSFCTVCLKITIWIKKKKRERFWSLCASEVQRGENCYVWCWILQCDRGNFWNKLLFLDNKHIICCSLIFSFFVINNRTSLAPSHLDLRKLQDNPILTFIFALRVSILSIASDFCYTQHFCFRRQYNAWSLCNLITLL